MWFPYPHMIVGWQAWRIRVGESKMCDVRWAGDMGLAEEGTKVERILSRRRTKSADWTPRVDEKRQRAWCRDKNRKIHLASRPQGLGYVQIQRK